MRLGRDNGKIEEKGERSKPKDVQLWTLGLAVNEFGMEPASMCISQT